MSARVALLGIYHESNTFIQGQTCLRDFQLGHWLSGSDILHEYREAFHEIGGIIEVLESEGIEIIPIMYAEATPGGIISSSTYASLLKEMINKLDLELPVDGCMVIPHGAAVSEDFRDMDGHWLSVLRNKVGATIPIIGTLDPHANVSELIAHSTDALIAYRTNPHVDQRETGKEAACLMVDTLKKKIKPQQVLLQLPMAISIEQQHTESEPCKSIFAFARRLASRKGILSISILFGFPYADVEEMGSSLIVISDNDKDLANDVASDLAKYIMRDKPRLIGPKRDIHEVLCLLEKKEKPILLLDMGDNIGAGAPGNSTYLLHTLEAVHNFKFFICLNNPEAVLQAEKFQLGDTFSMAPNNEDNDQLIMKVTLLRLADGIFKETDPRHGGQVHYNMGRTAIVSTSKGNIIMFNTFRVPPFSLCQLTSCGIDPKIFDGIVAKGVNAPIAAYGPVCKTIIKIDTPGVTQADMTLFNYRNRRRPLYPFEII